MERQKLIKGLRELHQALAETDPDDDEVRSLLATLHEDIERLEERREREDDEPESLEDRLESLAASFEGEHPRLAATTRELVHLLSSMGI